MYAVPHAVTAPVAHEGATAQPPEPVFLPARAIAATHTIPQYPSLAVRLGEQGDVHLVLTISETGAVVDARVTASSGYSQLDAAAVAWVEAHWRYEPAKRGDKPVTATSEAVVTFRLTGR
jgi:protein TonB